MAYCISLEKFFCQPKCGFSTLLPFDQSALRPFEWPQGPQAQGPQA